MIICYLGGVGSGKTLSVVKNIVDDNYSMAFTNFKLKKIKHYHRIKIDDIITAEQVNIGTEKKPKFRKETAINWDYWNKVRKEHKYFSIYLDEVHNIVHSRSSMSRRNVMMSKWISQIRKVLQDSNFNHIYLISQKINRIDVAFRELAHLFIECRKIEVKGKVIVLQTHYASLEEYRFNMPLFTTYFVGNPYFKYYDSLELIDFGDQEEFI